MGQIQIGVNNVPHKLKEAYVGIGGIPKKIKEVYVGVNGIPKLVWKSSPENITVLCGDWQNIYYLDKDGEINTGAFDVAPTNGQILNNQVAYGNGIFVAIYPTSQGSTSYNTYKSVDGINWKAVSNIFAVSTSSNSGIGIITFCNEYFFVPCKSGYLYYSKDGVNWTTSVALSGKYFKSIYYCNGKYYATGQDYVYCSTDLINWTLNNKLYKVTKMLVVGNSILYGVYTDATPQTINGLWIYDTLTDTNKQVYAGTISNYGKIVYGNGIYLAYASDYKLIYSTDMITWTLTSANSVIGYIYDLDFDGEKFVVSASSNGNRAAYSVNGIDWTVAGTTSRPVYNISSSKG